MNDKNNAMTVAQGTDMMVSGFADPESLEFLSEAMNDECAGLNFQFDRISVGSGGMTAFKMPGEGGKVKMLEEIVGVILHNHPANVYYRKAYDGSKNPPDCGSSNGIIGNGDPGGECAKCPYNKFGSSDKNNGKACKNRRMLYILQEGELFPIMLNLPVGSIRNYTDYTKRLLSKKMRVPQVVTRIELEGAQNSGGAEYSKATFKMVRVLNADERAVLNKMTEQVKEYAANLNNEALAEEDDCAVPFVDMETGELIEPLR